MKENGKMIAVRTNSTLTKLTAT